MSKFDRYKKKHKKDAKPEKRTLPHLGDVIESKNHGLGTVVERDSKSAKILYLDGLMQLVKDTE